MAIQLIAMDMDGTLLDDDHATVPLRNAAALRSARERGVKLAIASGRTWSLLQDAAKQVGGVDYAILANGASIWDTKGERYIYEDGIPNAQAVELIQGLEGEDLVFEIYCEGQNYILEQNVGRLADGLLSPQFAEIYLKRGVKLVSDLVQALGGRSMEKINLFHVPAEKKEKVCALARATGPVEISNALERNLEINFGGASKGKALAALAAHLGLKPEEVMAFGDANNDLAMLRWAGWSFAMANAMPEAKAVAKYQTASNHEAGVGQAVEKFVLGE